MKFWIRILIALGVVIVIAFGIWAFAFRESDEVQAFNKSAELIDYKQSLALDSRLEALSNMNYISGNAESTITGDSDDKNNINRYRTICLSQESVVVEEGVEYNSYMTIDNNVDKYLELYLPYLDSSKSKSKPRKQVKNAIDDYRTSLKTLSKELDNVTTYQVNMTDSSAEYSMLNEHYRNFYNAYRKSLNKASDVLLAMVEYIDICCYGDSIRIDAEFAMGDAYARLLNTTTKAKEIDEIKYLCDVKILIDTMGRFEDDQNIYIDQTEYEFLSSYNRLYNDKKSVLTKIFECDKEKRQQMAEGQSISDIEQSAHTDVINVLNVLGY